MADLNETPNYVDMFARAYQAGTDQAKAKGVRNALSMAQTDPQGAQSALIQYGDFQGANALGQISAQQRALKTQAAVAPQIQSGDYEGAAKTAAAGGQFDVADSIGKLSAQQREAVQAHSDLIARTAYGLAQKPAADRPALFEQIKPHLLQLGFKPEELASVDLSDQGLAQIAGQAMSVKDQIASHQKDTELAETAKKDQSTADLAKAEQANTAAYRQAELGQGAARIGIERQNAERAQWQVLQDPGNGGQPYRYNASTGAATTMDGSQAYTPKGAGKLAGGQPRSAPAMAVQKYMQENPDASSDDISQFNAKYKLQEAATKAFGVGPQGKIITSINTAVDHLATAKMAGEALKNGNIQLFNKIGNDLAQATGSPAPTNFDAVKQIVGTEVVKSIAGGAGGVHDREQAQAILSRVNSPAQLSGAIDQITNLMAGQLNSQRLSYQKNTGKSDFEDKLLPSTKAELESHGAAAAGGLSPDKAALAKSIFGFGH